MESDAHALVPQALQVIENVSTMATCVTVNEPECKRIADRFSAIGEGLTGVGQDQNFCDGKAIDASGTRKDYPDLHWLLEVLRRGEALLSLCRAGGEALVARCRDIWNGKQPEEFQKIHEELDSFKALFDFEGCRDGFAKDCDTVSGTMTTTEMKGDFVVEDYLKIDPLDIQLGELIGKGANAKVYEATWSGCLCAVKRFESEFMNQDVIPKLQKEVDFLIQLSHPFLVQLMGLSVDTEHRCSIVMELMSCSLRGLIESRKRSGKTVPFEFREAVMIIRKIAFGMRFVHSRGVSHRDLKAANVMVAERPGSIDVKIADFGESQFMDAGRVYDTAGTIAWMAPEILRPVGTSSKASSVDLKAADVYSFAMTCFEVLSGELPFSGRLNNEEKELVRSGLLRPVLPEDLDRRLIGLIKACWDSKPEKRPNFELICCILDQILGFRNHTRVSELSGRGESAGNWEVPGEPFFRDEIELFLDTVSGTMTTTEMEGEFVERKGDFVVEDFWKIDPLDIQLGKRIGKGANAEVYEATWFGCRCAVKRFKSACMNQDFIRKLQMELDFLIRLSHPFLVRLMGLSVDTEHRCSIVMELMSGSLRGLIESRKRSGKTVPFEFREAVMIIRKIALGMRFVHSRGVLHRDLKAANVMVAERPGSIDVKVADFGESQFMDASKAYGTAGTIPWMAPEILPPVATSSKASSVDLKAADVYSFAMTCFEVLSGEEPFSGSLNNEKKEKVRSGLLRPVLRVDLDTRLIGLIESCWDSLPAKRPNFELICCILDQILRSECLPR